MQLENRTSKQASGKMWVRLSGVSGSIRDAHWSVPAQGSSTVTIPYDKIELAPMRIYDAKIYMETEGGYRFEVSSPVDFLSAFYEAGGPVIDGRTTDSEQKDWVELCGKEQVVRNPQFYDGPEDQRVWLRLSYDEKKLYFFAKIQDDKHLQPYVEDKIWKGDCIQLGIDLDYIKGEYEETGNVLADIGSAHREMELGFALTEAGVQVYRWHTPDREKFPIALLKGEILKVEHRDGYLVYEADIPWEVLGRRDG
jgi:hypothetical protein